MNDFNARVAELVDVLDLGLGIDTGIAEESGANFPRVMQRRSIARQAWGKTLLLMFALTALACGDNITIDDEPDAALIGSTCEAINAWPECFRESCPGSQARTCSYTRLCQQWDDELCSCYQCRILYECWCE